MSRANTQEAFGDAPGPGSCLLNPKRCRIDSEYALDRRPMGVHPLLRSFRNASRQGRSVAGMMGRLFITGVALLVVSVGTLAAGSRLPSTSRGSSTWHTAKIARMAEKGDDTARSVRAEEARSYPPDAIPQPRVSFPTDDYFVPTLNEVWPQHAFRAPPHN
jgi:hypothetical protein